MLEGPFLTTLHTLQGPSWNNHSADTMSTDEPPSKYVRLISYEGFEFIVQRDASDASDPLRVALDPKSKTLQSLLSLLESHIHQRRTDSQRNIQTALRKHWNANSRPKRRS